MVNMVEGAEDCFQEASSCRLRPKATEGKERSENSRSQKRTNLKAKKLMRQASIHRSCVCIGLQEKGIMQKLVDTAIRKPPNRA